MIQRLRNNSHSRDRLSRRDFVARTLLGGAVLAGAAGAGQSEEATEVKETYETQAKDIRILPGKWRPHYPWEHIAWVSPSWPSQDYIWLDFPEAIFTDQGLLFLSHINPPIDTVYDSLPAVAWREIDGGIDFERELPNGVVFGGAVTKGSRNSVDLALTIRNGTTEPLTRITLQTCAFLRGIKEFADYTADNKYVHIAGKGWMPYPSAQELEAIEGAAYRVGWRRSGKLVCDKPLLATVSNQAKRLVAMTWFTDTLSMVNNRNHPCMHADPIFEDLAPEQSQTVHGKLIFFEGPIDEFDVDEYSA